MGDAATNLLPRRCRISVWNSGPPRLVDSIGTMKNPRSLLVGSLISGAAVIIFFEYFFLGDSSYTRLGDHQDSFLSRGISYASSGIPGWIPAIQFGVGADYVGHRALSLSNWVFQIAPSTITSLVLLLLSVTVSGIFLRKLHVSHGVPTSVSLLAISWFWIFLAREDLYWYVVALSFIPLVLWLLDSKTSANNMVVRAVLAGLIFVISNYLALTSIYLAAFVVAYVVIVGLGQSSTQQKKLAGPIKIFLICSQIQKGISI